MSLPLVTRFGADPLLDLEIANKRYVDNSSGGGSIFFKGVKEVDQFIQSQTTFEDDDDLLFAAEANKVYHIQLIFFFLTTSVADWDYRFSIPALAAGEYMQDNIEPVIESNAIDITGTRFSNVGVGTPLVLGQWCVLRMGATAGNVIFQWKQRSSVASNTGTLAGSCMLVYEA